jgi:hypothetical protein
MSCKIERIADGEDFVVVRVSGRIHGENADTLREVIGQEKGRLALDLTEVIVVDREAGEAACGQRGKWNRTQKLSGLYPGVGSERKAPWLWQVNQASTPYMIFRAGPDTGPTVISMSCRNRRSAARNPGRNLKASQDRGRSQVECWIKLGRSRLRILWFSPKLGRLEVAAGNNSSWMNSATSRPTWRRSLPES